MSQSRTQAKDRAYVRLCAILGHINNHRYVLPEKPPQITVIKFDKVAEVKFALLNCKLEPGEIDHLSEAFNIIRIDAVSNELIYSE